MTSTPTDRVRAALAPHDLDHADDDTCRRLAELVLLDDADAETVAEAMDGEGLALARHPYTLAAAQAVVDALRGEQR